MANGGSVKVDLVVDIPSDKVEQTKKDFEDDGYKVRVAKQRSGQWSLAAAKRG